MISELPLRLGFTAAFGFALLLVGYQLVVSSPTWLNRVARLLHALMGVLMIAMAWPAGMEWPAPPQVVALLAAAVFFLVMAFPGRRDPDTRVRWLDLSHAVMMLAMAWMVWAMAEMMAGHGHGGAEGGHGGQGGHGGHGAGEVGAGNAGGHGGQGHSVEGLSLIHTVAAGIFVLLLSAATAWWVVQAVRSLRVKSTKALALPQGIGARCVACVRPTIGDMRVEAIVQIIMGIGMVGMIIAMI